jgi:hypothetical protein
VCFSAEADLVAAAVVGAIGIDAMHHVRRRSQLPLASLPLVFAVHQFIEVFVWWGLNDSHTGVRSTIPVHTAAFVYLTIAFGLLPVLVPFAVAALEPSSTRARLTFFVIAGAAVSGSLMTFVARGPVTASIENHHIAYDAGIGQGGLVVVGYVVATCGALLGSRYSYIRRFGIVNAVVVPVLYAVDRGALVSLWCLWAALTSAAIADHLRYSSVPHVVAARAV